MSRPASFWLKLFRLADQEGVAEACRRMKVSRGHYYWRLDRYKRRGRAGLEPTSRRGPLKKPRLAPGIEEAVLELARNEPEMGRSARPWNWQSAAESTSLERESAASGSAIS
jgi:Helix-turn-helix domain